MREELTDVYCAPNKMPVAAITIIAGLFNHFGTYCNKKLPGNLNK
jgi:hypothetical protein